ncbi:MAG TPA: hypothetical protein DCM05_09890, partial [Elusimicrobia bacterium]|nr:hypothetical protein [Elusimicrobiota bacterium]
MGLEAGQNSNVIEIRAGNSDDPCAVTLTDTFLWDELPPTLTIYPDPGTSGDAILSSDATLTATGIDDLALSQVCISVESSGSRSNCISGSSGARTLSVALSLSGLSGAATLNAYASDSIHWCGYPELLLTRTFFIDSEPPQVGIVSPLDADPGSAVVAISGTASDNVGLASGNIRILDEATGMYWDGSAFVPGTVSLPIGGLSGKLAFWSYAGLSAAVIPAEGGIWDVTVEATDLVGKTGSATERIIIRPKVVVKVPTPPETCPGGGTNAATGGSSYQN